MLNYLRWIAVLSISVFLLSCTQDAWNDFIVNKDWGALIFKDGIPVSLMLQKGSGLNLLSSDKESIGLYKISYEDNDTTYSSGFDEFKEIENYGDSTIVVRGTLRSKEGTQLSPPIQYTMTWIIDDLGFIRVSTDIDKNPGQTNQIKHTFSINGETLNEYYTTGFRPVSLYQSSTLRDAPPLDSLTGEGKTVTYDDYALGRVFGFVNSEREAMNFVIKEGFISSVTFQDSIPVTLTYVDSTPADRESVQASFYVLPAPVKEHPAKIRRIYTSVTRPDNIAPTPEAFIDTLDQYGIQDYVYMHRWRQWNFTNVSPERDLTYVAADAERLEKLINAAHDRGKKVFLYLNLIPEEHGTVWWQNNEGGRYETEHPFPGRSDQRDIMCLNSPFFNHRIDDIDYMLDEVGADGVFVDWFVVLGCTRSHKYHEHLPSTNIQQLIDLVRHVQSKGKEFYIHSSEESRIPFLEELGDRYMSGERGYDLVNYQSTKSGMFDRWTSNKGRFDLILDPRWGITAAQHQTEVNAALLEGLNPFGFVYRPELYGIPGEVEADEFHEDYVFRNLRALQPFNLEQMTLLPEDDTPAFTDERAVGFAAFAGQDTVILYVVNKDKDVTRSPEVRLNTKVLPIKEGQYHVKFLLQGGTEKTISLESLIDAGIRVNVPANQAEILAFIKQ